MASKRKQKFRYSICSVRIPVWKFVYFKFQVGRAWYIKTLIGADNFPHFLRVNDQYVHNPAEMVGLGDRITVEDEGQTHTEVVQWYDLFALFDK